MKKFLRPDFLALKYIKILRLDHWIKQFFVIPGYVCAILLNPSEKISAIKFFMGFFSVCFIASANYSINEYLDADFDKFHPVKKNRSLVSGDFNPIIIYLLYFILTVTGFITGLRVNLQFFLMMLLLWVMGIIYNVKPFRTKDIVFLDVLSESLNNAIRLMAGWFIVSNKNIPPCSLIIGYWTGGAFLMAAKRYAEYKMINNPDLAGKYRKSFKFYSEKSLLISTFFYAMCSVFFTGIFLIKYRIELILFVPAMIGLFCYYFFISFKADTAVQKPEKLYRERGLMMYCAVLILLFMIFALVDIPFLKIFTDSRLIEL